MGVFQEYEPGFRILNDPAEVCEMAAGIVLDRIAEKPNASLLVPTGSTPETMYDILAVQQPDRFKGVTFFNLDEYCEPDGCGGYKLLNAEDPRSYQHYMQTRILNDIPTIYSYFPGIENKKEPGRYDRLIKVVGGIQLAVNGLGENGHVFGFNEPGSPHDSISRFVELDESTVQVNGGLTSAHVPRHAVTAGIATGLASEEVITLVTGARKALALRRALHDEIGPANPSTWLRLHPNHLWILDREAAAGLGID